VNALDDIVTLSSARSVGSARSENLHRAGPSGSVRPSRSSLRIRPIIHA
jgi:hypothetical protein